MSRQANSFVENTFVRGLITEATGLNFPEQAVTETDNCVFDERGLVRRRGAFDFEANWDDLTADRDDVAVSTYRWDAAGGDGENVIVVLQVGNTLHFYLTSKNGTVSENLFDTIDLTAFIPAGSSLSPATVECQYAAGKGYLFVSNPHIESFYAAYDSALATVTPTAIEVKIRDFEGVEDGLDIAERPSTLTEAHEYNLHNQGWNINTIPRTGDDAQVYPLDQWDTSRTDFPSNADIWYFFTELGASNFKVTSSTRDPGLTPAPKGSFVLPYYNQDRNAATPINPARSFSGLTTTTSGDYRASTIEFFSGRVWYAGVIGNGYSNRILYSQIIERDTQIGTCHQYNDPTAQVVFDLLPTDGGTILIPDSGTIVKLFAFEDSLLVFATNGVWSISGSQGVGFNATDYSVVKIANVGCLTSSSFVNVDGTPCFWNGEAIYIVARGQTGSVQIQSLTDDTIRDFYNSIPYESKRYARGAYNRATRVISWLYSSAAPTTVTARSAFNRVLNFNLLSKAFYGWSVDTSVVTLNGAVAVVDLVGEGPSVVTDNLGAIVTDNALAEVWAFDIGDLVVGETIKFICSRSNGAGSYKFTFAEAYPESFTDWFLVDSTGSNFVSSFTTGYKVHGDGQRRVSPTYINLYFKTSDVDSSIDFRSIWQYATSGGTGKYSTAQRVVTDSNDYSFTKKRLKSRGSGTAYQFNVTSVTGEPFHLIGWSVFETTNATP